MKRSLFSGQAARPSNTAKGEARRIGIRQAAALLKAAEAARRFAYAPYSRYRVGAAVLGERGKIYTGVNVENASYGLTLCAERVALVKAVSAGERRIRAVAVSAGKGNRVSPCGACRQMLYEFGREAVVLRRGASVRKLSELLPDAFFLI